MIFVFAASFLLLKNRNGSPAITPTRSVAERTSGWVLATAGLLVGLAALIKPMNLIFLVPLMIWVPELRGIRPRAILLGFAVLPLLLSVLMFALKPGGLDAYWTATILFNKDVYATISRPFPDFLKWLISPKVFAIPLVVGIIALLAGRRFPFAQRSITNHSRARNERAIYLSFVLLALAIVLMQRKYYSYHFVMFVVLLTPIAAHGIESFLGSGFVRRIVGDALLPRRVAWVILFAGLWILSLPYETLLQSFRHRYPTESFAHILQSSFRSMAWPDPSDEPTLEYLSQPDRAHASVEVASFDPGLRFRLARLKEGKYPTLEALGYRTNRNDPHAFTDYQRVWRRAYLDSLRVLRPEYFILSREPSAEYLQDPYADVLHYLEGFDSLLQMNYARDTIIGTNEVYRLKD